jgi:N-acetylmuramoyl-L-alanine amidase
MSSSGSRTGLFRVPKFKSPPIPRRTSLELLLSLALKSAIVAMTFLAATAAEGPQSLHIVDKPIPFDKERIRLTLEYIHKHYATDAENITITPQAIVLHYTVMPTFDATWTYFSHTRIEAARPELQREGELNVSAHFLVDRDGTVYRLMPETWMARHCIGLNRVAIGIENVGDGAKYPLTDRQVEANASLVRYLAGKYSVAYLLGHNEYRRMEKTPLFLELVPGYRTEKSDPGDEFLGRVRERLSDLHLKAPPL